MIGTTMINEINDVFTKLRAALGPMDPAYEVAVALNASSDDDAVIDETDEMRARLLRAMRDAIEASDELCKPLLQLSYDANAWLAGAETLEVWMDRLRAVGSHADKPLTIVLNQYLAGIVSFQLQMLRIAAHQAGAVLTWPADDVRAAMVLEAKIREARAAE